MTPLICIDTPIIYCLIFIDVTLLISCFTHQIHNNDGVWLRLSADSIHTWCRGRGEGIEEAWTLQYNQHLGRTLLVPTDEPKTMPNKETKEIRNTNPRRTSKPVQSVTRPYRGEVFGCLSSHSVNDFRHRNYPIRTLSSISFFHTFS